jgi:hypothetical protein
MSTLCRHPHPVVACHNGSPQIPVGQPSPSTESEHPLQSDPELPDTRHQTPDTRHQTPDTRPQGARLPRAHRARAPPGRSTGKASTGPPGKGSTTGPTGQGLHHRAHLDGAPATGHRPPATGHRPPATGHRPPATFHGKGSTGPDPPGPIHRARSTGPDPPGPIHGKGSTGQGFHGPTWTEHRARAPPGPIHRARSTGPDPREGLHLDAPGKGSTWTHRARLPGGRTGQGFQVEHRARNHHR